MGLIGVAVFITFHSSLLYPDNIPVTLTVPEDV